MAEYIAKCLDDGYEDLLNSASIVDKVVKASSGKAPGIFIYTLKCCLWWG